MMPLLRILGAVLLAGMLLNNAEAATIYPIGDSITRGAPYTFDGTEYPDSAYRFDADLPATLLSYREHLHDLLTSPSCEAEVNWVGTRNEPDRLPVLHEGFPGRRVDQFLSSTWSDGSGSNPRNDLGDWLVEFEPDYVLIHLGTNDMLQGQSAESTIAELNDLLDIIYAEQSNAKVYLANVIPISGWWGNHIIISPFSVADVQFEAEQLTGLIELLVLERAGEGDDIHLVDVNSSFFVNESDVVDCATEFPGDAANMSASICVARPDGSGLEPDAIHPNIIGDKFIADQFFAVMNETSDICTVDVPEDDTYPPDAEISSPTSDAEILPPVAVLSGSATDTGGSGIDTVEVSIQNSNGQWINFVTGELEDNFNSVEPLINNTVSDRVDWVLSTPVLRGGSYTLTVTVWDKDGNSTASTRSFVVNENVETGQGEIVDISEDDVPEDDVPEDEFPGDESSEPVTLIIMPGREGEVLPSVAVFSGSVSDAGGSGIIRLEIGVQNSRDHWLNFATGELEEAFNSVEPLISSIAGDRVDWIVSTPELPDGIYTLSVSVWNNNGNVSTTTISFVVNENSGVGLDEPDRLFPTISIEVPSGAGEIFPSSVRLSGIASDTGGAGLDSVMVAIQNGGGGWLNFSTGEFEISPLHFPAQLSFTTTESANWAISAPSVPDGVYLFTVTALDKAANESLITATVVVDAARSLEGEEVVSVDSVNALPESSGGSTGFISLLFLWLVYQLRRLHQHTQRAIGEN